MVLGVAFLGILQNGLPLVGVPTLWQQVAQGLARVVAAGLAYLAPRLEALAAVRPQAAHRQAARPRSKDGTRPKPSRRITPETVQLRSTLAASQQKR